MSFAPDILEHSPSVVYVTGTDSCLAAPSFVSAAVEGLVGLQPEPLVSGAVCLWDRLHPEDREVTLERLRAAPVERPTSLADYRFETEGGDTIWVSHRLVHRPAYTAHFIQDITDRKQVEQQLEFHRKRLELVLEGTRLGMWDWNPQTNEVAFNERWAEMLGHDLAEIDQNLSSWESRVHPDDLDSCYADISAHVEGRVSFYENVHRMRHKDGRWVYILDRGKVVERDAEGRPLRFTGTHTDITPQKQAEFEARAAADAKSYFLANMSHELRGPLNGILGLNHLLLTSVDDPEHRGYLEVIKECGESLLVIINDILDFSRIEAGKLQLAPEVFDLYEVIDGVEVLCRERVLSKRLALRRSVAPEVPQFVEADPNRLRQVLMNLLTNAIKFTERGEVGLSVRLREESAAGCVLEFCVSDTGVGISAADRELIFDRFAQAERGRTRGQGGTGLGLSISRLLVELFGGRLWVDSERGKGARFYFTLHTRRAQPVESPAEPEVPSLAGMEVLAAEDNPINQLVLTKTLGQLGARCTVVANGRLAVDAARGRRFDVVLLDLHMPELDGVETTRTLRQEHGAGCPPVVGLSADAFADTRQACIEAGMVDFVTKPFNPGQLARVIAAVTG